MEYCRDLFRQNENEIAGFRTAMTAITGSRQQARDVFKKKVQLVAPFSVQMSHRSWKLEETNQIQKPQDNSSMDQTPRYYFQ